MPIKRIYICDDCKCEYLDPQNVHTLSIIVHESYQEYPVVPVGAKFMHKHDICRTCLKKRGLQSDYYGLSRKVAPGIDEEKNTAQRLYDLVCEIAAETKEE